MSNDVILIPHYLKEFECTGDECKDNCCYDWEVFIDKETFYKYRNINNIELKDILRKNVVRNRINPNNQTYGKLKMDKNCKCVFLEGGLCKIQKSMGSEYLSNICSTFPRISNKVDGVYEISATVACPEISRIALLNENIMEFYQLVEENKTKKMIIRNLDTADGEKNNDIKKYFWNLRSFSISLVQNRDYILWERLVLLGMFCRKIQNETDNGTIENVLSDISLYENLIKDREIKKELRDIPSNQTVQINIIKSINDYKLNNSVISQSYLKCVNEFLIGLQVYEDSSSEEIEKRYNEAYELYYHTYFKQKEYILENYIINHMFTTLFPMGSGGKVFDDYCKLIVHYSFIKTMLIGISAYYKKLDDDIVMNLIYSFSRNIEHTNYIEDIFSDFKDQSFDNMAYMSILIKN